MERMIVRIGLGGLVVVGTALLMACGGDKAKAQGPYAKEVAEAIPVIEKGTGLKFKRPPVIQTRTKAQVREFLEKQFAEQLSDSELAGQQIVYTRLGIIPDTLKIKTLLLDLLSEQVAGFYDPKTKVLYVVDGAPRDRVGFVVSHELIHALQDQYMNLDSLQHISGENDRALAAQAVLEGQATLVPLKAMLGPGASLPAGWDRVRDFIREQQNQMPVFASAPFAIQELLLFPYLSGAEFMKRYEGDHPNEPPFGKNMPSSTEQILHATAYSSTARDEPTTVTLPKPSTGTVTYQDDLGEFEIRLFLFQHLQDQNDAVRGAAGWDGDRYFVIHTPQGDGLVWLTVWDSAVDAADFGSDMEQIIAKRFNSPAAHESAAGKSYSIPNRTLTLWGGEIGGKSAVFYTDLPQGVSSDIIDLKKVQLKE